MAVVARPPTVLTPKPDRTVQVIKLHRKTYFGIHSPVNALHSAADSVTEASVLAFSRRADAKTVAGWLANHREITRLWPSRLVDVGSGLQVNAGEMQPAAEAEVPPTDLHGLTIEEEPFSLFLQSLSLEGVAMRLITDVHADGRMQSTVFKEKMQQQAIQQHFQALMAKKCSHP